MDKRQIDETTMTRPLGATTIARLELRAFTVHSRYFHLGERMDLASDAIDGVSPRVQLRFSR